MKQSKLRKRRVWRYAVLYFTLFVVALALLIGPIVAGKQILDGAKSFTDDPKKLYDLFQPIGLNHNDTQNRNETGTGGPGGGAAASTSSGAASTNKIKLF